MSTRDRRRAERIEVGIPAQIYSHRGFFSARICDLSRTGLRLRVRIADIDMEATDDLRVAAEAIAAAFAPHFALDLDYEKFGPLLQRDVSLTRIGLPPEDPLFVELCCAFDEPLGDHETAILQMELPEINAAVEDWVPDEFVPEDCSGIVTLRPRDELMDRPVILPPAEPARAPAPPPPRHRYRALVTGTAKDAPPAFFCYTDLVTAIGVRVCVPRPTDAIGIREAMTQLMRVHGQAVDVRIIDESEDLWAGGARVTGVELPPNRLDVMLVTLAYDRPLSMSALRRMGLVVAA